MDQVYTGRYVGAKGLGGGDRLEIWYEKIVLLRSQSPEEDSDNRTPGALACLVLCLGLIYRAHAGLYENEMPPIPLLQPATANNDRYLSLSRPDSSQPRWYQCPSFLFPPTKERNRFSIFAQPETTFPSFHSSAILRRSVSKVNSNNITASRSKLYSVDCIFVCGESKGVRVDIELNALERRWTVSCSISVWSSPTDFSHDCCESHRCSGEPFSVHPPGNWAKIGASIMEEGESCPRVPLFRASPSREKTIRIVVSFVHVFLSLRMINPHPRGVNRDTRWW